MFLYVGAWVILENARDNKVRSPDAMQLTVYDSVTLKEEKNWA